MAKTQGMEGQSSEEIRPKAHRGVGRALLIAGALMAGCARHNPEKMTIAGENTPAAIVATAAPTPTPLPTECPDNGFDIRTIAKTEVAPAEKAAPKAAASTVRIEAVPGPNRIDCLGATGTVIESFGRDQFAVATAGHTVTAATTGWIVPWPGGPREPARILAYDTTPDLAVMTFACEPCRGRLKAAEVPDRIPAGLEDVQMAGHTSGAIATLAHPAAISDGVGDFGRLGKSDAFVYTLVSGAGAAADGIWTKNGGLLGMAFYEDAAPDRNNVTRVLFIPTDGIRQIVDKVLSAPGARDARTPPPNQATAASTDAATTQPSGAGTGPQPTPEAGADASGSATTPTSPSP